MSDSPNSERSAGALLRAARERQGLHIAALAAAIKVTPRKLEALEADRWSELPDATFARALAQTVCRSLKMDAKPVLDLLPPAGGVGFQSAGMSLNTPFREKPGHDEPGFKLSSVRPLVWAAGLLLIGAVALYFVPTTWWSGKGWLGLPAAVVGSAPAPAPVQSAASVAITLPAPAPAAAASAATSVLTAAPTATAPTLPASAAGETVFSAPPQTQAGATPAAGAVQLRVSEASWMDVRDAKGQVLLSRMVQPGESVGLDGTPPLRLTIGNASATQLGYRGQAIDILKFSVGNVARLELR